MDEILDLIAAEREPLIRRLRHSLGGDHAAAEDLAQETLLRAWQRLPPGLAEPQRRAWLGQTSRRLAIDELRRRGRRPAEELHDELSVGGTTEGDVVDEALAMLSSHERFILLLRFDGGYSHAEIGALLGIGEDAARKRVARARSAFLRARRRAAAGSDPLILLVIREDEPESYVRWLESAGARVRRVTALASERDLSLADGIVFTGSQTDLDSRLYGEAPRTVDGEPDLARDRADLGTLKGALALDLPVVGICRGGQLLNVASGGTLYQDVVADGLTRVRHSHIGIHPVDTAGDSAMRELLGRRAEVSSVHHQAVRRLGARLRVTASSQDGVVESIERTDRRFAIGLQWHPELEPSGPSVAGRRVAEALVRAARERPL